MGWNGHRSQLRIKQDRQDLSLPTSMPQVTLHNRFEALKLEGEESGDAMEGLPRRLYRVKWLTPCLKTASAKKERKIVIRDSLLRRTEGVMSARLYL